MRKALSDNVLLGRDCEACVHNPEDSERELRDELHQVAIVARVVVREYDDNS